MSDCAHEHDDNCGHNHDHNQGSETQPNNLFSRVDLPNVIALNTTSTDPQKVIKPWHERRDEVKFIESDADDQLIVRIPFTGSVKLRSILLKSGPGAETPTKICLYPNAETLDFDDVADKEPTQEFHVAQSRDVGEYSVKPAKFSSVRSLTLFFPGAQGADSVKIFYLGFLGEWSELRSQPVITLYETQANPADHPKIPGLDGATSRPGM